MYLPGRYVCVLREREAKSTHRIGVDQQDVQHPDEEDNQIPMNCCVSGRRRRSDAEVLSLMPTVKAGAAPFPHVLVLVHAEAAHCVVEGGEDVAEQIKGFL